MADMDVPRTLKKEDDSDTRDENGDNSDSHSEHQVMGTEAPQENKKLLQKFKNNCIRAVHPSWKRGNSIDSEVLANINKARLMKTGDKLPKLSAQPPYVQLKRLLVNKSDDIPAALAEAVRVMGDGRNYTRNLCATMIAAGWHPDWICDPKKTTAARKLKNSGVDSANEVCRRLGIDRDLIKRAANSINLRQTLPGVLCEDEDEDEDGSNDLVMLATAISRNFACLPNLVDSQDSYKRRLQKMEDHLNALQETSSNIEKVVVDTAARHSVNEPGMRQRMDSLEMMVKFLKSDMDVMKSGMDVMKSDMGAMRFSMDRMLFHLEARSTQQSLPHARPAQSTQQPLPHARPVQKSTQQVSIPRSTQQPPAHVDSAQSTQFFQPDQQPPAHVYSAQPAQLAQPNQQPSHTASSMQAQSSATLVASCDDDAYPSYPSYSNATYSDESDPYDYYEYPRDPPQRHHSSQRQGHPQGYPRGYSGGYQ